MHMYCDCQKTHISNKTSWYIVYYTYGTKCTNLQHINKTSEAFERWTHVELYKIDTLEQFKIPFRQKSLLMYPKKDDLYTDNHARNLISRNDL